MSDALRCDGPGCENAGVFPYLGWWQLQAASPLIVLGEPGRLDFCSWECLGAFVFQQAADVNELERRIHQLEDEQAD